MRSCGSGPSSGQHASIHRDYHHPQHHYLSLLRSSLTVADSDPIGALDKNAGDGDTGHGPVVEADELEKILGLSRHDREDRDREAKRSVVWGLVVTGIGEGDLMPVESIVMHENGNPKLIGLLDDVRYLAPCN